MHFLRLFLTRPRNRKNLHTIKNIILSRICNNHVSFI